MRRALAISLGAALAGFVGFLLGSAVSQYQVRVLLYGPDQSGEFIDFFLVVWPLFFIFGGWFGNSLYRRNITRRSGGPR